ncbi:MAG: hypothetical protein ACFFCQ_09895 [Promethearchaeota archaeon]
MVSIWEEDEETEHSQEDELRSSYFERLVSLFIKRIVFGGFRVLFHPSNAFFATTMFLIIVSVTGIALIIRTYPQDSNLLEYCLVFESLISILFIFIAGFRYVNLSERLTTILFIISCLAAGPASIFIVESVHFDNILNSVFWGWQLICFWLWISVLVFNFFLFFRSLLTGIMGKTVWIGASEGRILFKEFLIVLLILNGLLTLFIPTQIIFLNNQDSLYSVQLEPFLFILIALCGWIITVLWFTRGKLSLFVFVTIHTFFFCFSTYHLWLAISPQISGLVASIDVIFLGFMLLYSAQATTKRLEDIENPTRTEDNSKNSFTSFGITYQLSNTSLTLLAVITGLLLGFHAFAINRIMDKDPAYFSWEYHRIAYYCTLLLITSLPIVFHFWPSKLESMNYLLTDREALIKLYQIVKTDPNVRNWRKELFSAIKKRLIGDYSPDLGVISRKVGSKLMGFVGEVLRDRNDNRYDDEDSKEDN